MCYETKSVSYYNEIHRDDNKYDSHDDYGGDDDGDDECIYVEMTISMITMMVMMNVYVGHLLTLPRLQLRSQ